MEEFTTKALVHVSYGCMFMTCAVHIILSYLSAAYMV